MLYVGYRKIALKSSKLENEQKKFLAQEVRQKSDISKHLRV